MNFKLVTDHPDNNTERLMNLAYIKDGEVWLRLEPDVKLCEYTAKACVGRGCEEATPEEVLESGLLDCNCPLAMLYSLAIQAATLRDALKIVLSPPSEKQEDDS